MRTAPGKRPPGGVPMWTSGLESERDAWRGHFGLSVAAFMHPNSQKPGLAKGTESKESGGKDLRRTASLMQKPP